MKVVTICTKNYEDGLDFCIPSWFYIPNVNITVLTDFDRDDEPGIQYLKWMDPTNDWLDVVGRKVHLLERYIAEFQPKQFIFLDIDCWLYEDISDVFDVPFDLAVTRIHHPKSASTGILFVNCTEATNRFLRQWKARQHQYRKQGKGVKPHRQSYSQLSFSDILRSKKLSNGLNVFPLSGDVYNCEDDDIDRWIHKINLYRPKVIHFKARRWRNKKIVDRIL